MGVLCKEIIRFMEQTAPAGFAEEWDNVGLLAGNEGDMVNRILLCLDVTSEVVDEAVKKNAELIISHHPLIFKGLKRLLEDDAKGNILYKLIRNKIAVYSAHTNLDVVNGGVNYKLAEILGLKEIKKLKDSGTPDTHGEASYYEGHPKAKAGIFGLGAIGVLERPTALDAFISLVKKSLGMEDVRVIGGVGTKVIERVAVFCGSFDDDLNAAARHDADILVTGDVKYHTAMDALASGICVIDAGHFNTEKIILPVLAEAISKEFQLIEVFCNNVEADPFKTY